MNLLTKSIIYDKGKIFVRILCECINSKYEGALKSTLFLLVLSKKKRKAMRMFTFSCCKTAPETRKGFYKEQQGRVFDRGPTKTNLKMKHK